VTKKIKIPDYRSTDPEDYKTFRRRGRMKQSWELGIKHSKSNEILIVDDGITWGSIGQILGYLLGEQEETFQEELFKKMRKQYGKSVHGHPVEKGKSTRKASERNTKPTGK
jgi:hypothetical protein